MTRFQRLVPVFAMAFALLAADSALAARCPNILIVFDVSGSMGGIVSGTQTRYQVGRDAVKGLLNGNTANFRYGLELFGTAANSSCGVSACFYPQSGCESVLSDYGTTAAISAVLDARAHEGGTPTSSAINEGKFRTDMQDTTRARYMILLTDGDPNCSSNPMPDTEAALSSARTAGIKTYVLGFAGGTATNLNRMAIAGGTQRFGTCDTGTNKCFYDAANAAELNTALAAIVSAVGGELGGAACDDTCYGTGCNTGQICRGSSTGGQPSCVADPCASVTCAAPSVCVEGACKAPCNPACLSDQYCDNGVCKTEATCTGVTCTGRNQTCVNGQCVEDYCNHPQKNLNAACSPGLCIKNACQVFSTGTGGGAGGGTGTGGGAGGNRDGGAGGGTTANSGCCSGAPGATSLFGLMLGVAVLVGMRRRVRKS